MAASAATETARSRQALVDLLALVDPQEAERWADRLIYSRGTVGRVLSARPEALAQLVGPPAADALIAARDMMAEILRRRVDARPVLKNRQAVHDYLHAAMAHRSVESARVLHLDSSNVLIREEQISEGSLDQTAIHIREIAQRAFELGTAAIILVHNHPSGNPSPSKQDIILTREIVAALKPLNIRVHDHLIIGTSGHVSLREMGIV